MTTHEQDTFRQTYDWAGNWEQLPWAHEAPTLFLAEICAARAPGAALDIGCGAGTDSVFLASRGWDVTSLDFVPKALEFTVQRAQAAGVDITPVEADITAWEPSRRFDLVLDHGLLHNMDPVRHAAYRERVMGALADDGDFVLLHWHPLFPGQGNGRMGPTRVDRDDIRAFFAPELQEQFFAAEEFDDLPGIVGGGMRQAYYWFRRNPAHLQPGIVIEQIEATLQRHDVDFAALIEAAGDAPLAATADDALLATIVGPGRLGVEQVRVAPGEIAAVIARFAASAGRSARYVDNLLRIFASAEHGNICLAEARCGECGVALCKRKRHR